MISPATAMKPAAMTHPPNDWASIAHDDSQDGDERKGTDACQLRGRVLALQSDQKPQPQGDRQMFEEKRQLHAVSSRSKANPSDQAKRIAHVTRRPGTSPSGLWAIHAANSGRPTVVWEWPRWPSHWGRLSVAVPQMLLGCNAVTHQLFQLL